MELKTKNIVMVGTGAFGTAVANVISQNELNNITLYGIDTKEINDINNNHKNSKYFGVKLDTKLKATSDKNIFSDADIIVLGLPSQVLKDVIKKDIIPFMTKPAYFVNLSKGLDYSSLQLLSDLILQIVPKKLNKGILKLSGPSYAIEVAKKQPTLFTLGCEDKKVCSLVREYFLSETTEVVCNENLRAVEAISVVKNPLAIMLGVIRGLGYEENASAYVFTLALQEMKLMLELFDIKNSESTILSSAGIGDLLLTGTSLKSRNFSTGYKIGKEDKVTKKILSSFTTIEGLRSLELIIIRAQSKKIKLPLIEMLYNITYKKKIPSKTVEDFFMGNK